MQANNGQTATGRTFTVKYSKPKTLKDTKKALNG